jgi:hypothetical protein
MGSGLPSPGVGGHTSTPSLAARRDVVPPVGCVEVAHLVAERGGTHVYINAQPQPGYVAPTSAYFAAGFELVERATTYSAQGARNRSH